MLTREGEGKTTIRKTTLTTEHEQANKHFERYSTGIYHKQHTFFAFILRFFYPMNFWPERLYCLRFLWTSFSLLQMRNDPKQFIINWRSDKEEERERERGREIEWMKAKTKNVEEFFVRILKDLMKFMIVFHFQSGFIRLRRRQTNELTPI